MSTKRTTPSNTRHQPLKPSIYMILIDPLRITMTFNIHIKISAKIERKKRERIYQELCSEKSI